MVNPFKDVNWNPNTAEKRKFALSLMIGFPIIALIFALGVWFKSHEWRPFFLWLGTGGFSAGFILWLLPQVAKPFYLVWFFLACCMGVMVSNLLLAALFYFVLTPTGLLLRLFKRLPFTRKFDRTRTTYWLDAEKGIDAGRYYRQF